MSIGIHIVGDLKGVERNRISDVNSLREIMESAVKRSKLTKIRSYYHQFSPDGVSGVILLAESHLSFHSWPEYGLIAVDIFTCGPTENAEEAMEYIIDKLSPSSIEYKRIERGIDYPRGTQKVKILEVPA